MGINVKHRRFADEYLIDLNATQAYFRAGYKATERTANANAAKLLARPEVAAYIDRRQRELQRKTGVTQEAVLEELRRIAFANTTEIVAFKKHGRGGRVVITPTDQLGPDEQAAIAGIKAGKFGVEIKLHDKVRALELLARHLGILEGKPEAPDTGSLSTLIKGLQDDIQQ